MAYAYAGEGSLDYSVCRYGQARLLFRGPPRDINLPFVAALGGTETYGKFLDRPWPDRVEALTGFRMVNFGCISASPDAYLFDPGALEVIARSRAAVIQLSGAANLSNRFFAVHPRRNDRFVRARPALSTLYPEVDFTNFHFTRHLLLTLARVAPRKFDLVADELRRTWVARTRQLIAALRVPVVLLTMAPWPSRSNRGSDPLPVDPAMLDAVRDLARDMVMVEPSDDALHEGVAGMTFAPMDRPAASELPGSLAHQEMALAVARSLERLL